MNIMVKQVSSLEKIRELGDIPDNCYENAVVLGGESFSYQIAVCSDICAGMEVACSSPLAEYIKIYRVDRVYMDMPNYDGARGAVITDTPSMMPDLLTPIENLNGFLNVCKIPECLWVQVDIPRDFKAGKYSVEIKLSGEWAGATPQPFAVSQTMNIEVLGVNLPEQKLIFTQWFHTDCIAAAHNVPVYSEEHWALIDKYMKMAAELGINMLLTPVLTPALDTAMGKRRPCVQLVGIKKDGYSYKFDFSKLSRWIELCRKNGIKYYEISHLFSQWGLKYTPNILAEENGEEKYIFGWHVDARDESYRVFLGQFLPALVAFLKEEGVYDKCRFHLSDEPTAEHLDNYRYAYELVRPLIGDGRIMDAISHLEVFETGCMDIPVCTTTDIEPFLAKKYDNQWAYYCCAQSSDVSNRFMAMPSFRNRIIGLQLYKYDIKGFLQWGYNFYYSRGSKYELNPYTDTSAGKAFPSGDAFSVYPGKDGPLASLRALVFREALQDIELCRLAEKHIGRAAVIKLIEDEAGAELTFGRYPQSSEYLLRVNARLKELLRGKGNN